MGWLKETKERVGLYCETVDIIRDFLCLVDWPDRGSTRVRHIVRELHQLAGLDEYLAGYFVEIGINVVALYLYRLRRKPKK